MDIQPIAVQIAKLRFFISLIVDQKPLSTDPPFEKGGAGGILNLGIRPLPNLETKFVAANTLIGIERPQQLMLRNPDIDKKEAELKKVRECHFTARTPQTKEKYRKEDERLRTEIAEMLRNDGFPAGVTKKLAEWNPYDQNTSADFFDPEWMFGIKSPSPLAGAGKGEGGFDIVIGNPPYFNVNTIDRDLFDYLSKHYPAIHTGYNDIVYYFIYLGIELLKEPGCCVLITSNYYLGNEYARKLRAYLNDHATKIINFKDHMVFDAASIHTCISISQKKVISDEIVFFESTTDKQITSSNIEAELRSFAGKRSELKDNWIVADQSNTSIFEKLKQGSLLLDEIAIIEKGSTSGKNDIFTVPYGFAIKTKMEPAVLRKNIKNGDIDRYILRDRGNFLIYVDNNTTIEHFPNIYSYLKKHKEVLSNRNEAKQGLYPWCRLERPRNKAVFDANEKIVVPYRAENNRFAYDNNQYFNDGGDIRAIVINNSNFNIKYVLAILNSKLLDWFYGFIGKPKGKVREYFNKPLSLIPIKSVSLSEQKPFITLVDQILAVTSHQFGTGFRGMIPT